VESKSGLNTAMLLRKSRRQIDAKSLRFK